MKSTIIAVLTVEFTLSLIGLSVWSLSVIHSVKLFFVCPYFSYCFSLSILFWLSFVSCVFHLILLSFLSLSWLVSASPFSLAVSTSPNSLGCIYKIFPLYVFFFFLDLSVSFASCVHWRSIGFWCLFFSLWTFASVSWTAVYNTS